MFSKHILVCTDYMHAFFKKRLQNILGAFNAAHYFNDNIHSVIFHDFFNIICNDRPVKPAASLLIDILDKAMADGESLASHSCDLLSVAPQYIDDTGADCTQTK